MEARLKHCARAAKYLLLLLVCSGSAGCMSSRWAQDNEWQNRHGIQEEKPSWWGEGLKQTWGSIGTL